MCCSLATVRSTIMNTIYVNGGTAGTDLVLGQLLFDEGVHELLFGDGALSGVQFKQ